MPHFPMSLLIGIDDDRFLDLTQNLSFTFVQKTQDFDQFEHSKMAAIAPATAFRNALTRMGINLPTRTAIIEKGFITVHDLVSVQDKDLDKLPKHLEAWRVPGAPPNAQVRIPFLSLTKLKALRCWVLAQRCIGVENPNANDFTGEVIVETLARMKADGDYKLATEDTDIRKPEKLADLAKWTKFWELLTTYLGRVKGAALTPLSYLVREHEEVTPAHHDAEYQSVQERLIATTALNGTHFELDKSYIVRRIQAACRGWTRVEFYKEV